MENQRVLVTGGAGFIGSNLANALGRTTTSSLSTTAISGRRRTYSGVEFVEQSVLDDDLPTDVDVVFHLAALSSYAMHEDNPTHGARVNVEGFVNTVEQAREDGCETVVYASTSSIYGSRTEPSPEDMPVEARTCYEASKLAREKYGEYFHHHYDMTLAGLRFFSVYQGYGGAEEHKGEYANTVAQFADEIANGERRTVRRRRADPRLHPRRRHRPRARPGRRTRTERRVQPRYRRGLRLQHRRGDAERRARNGHRAGVHREPDPRDVYVHDTCADFSKMHEATGWEPETSFEEGIELVCAPIRRT